MEDVKKIIRSVIVGICVLVAHAQPPSSRSQLHYIDEVGHLGTDVDGRKSAKYGAIEVRPEVDGGLRIQGQDDSGRPWSATVQSHGGVGWTDLWRADFDQNGRQDLLFAAYFPLNGRCVDEITLSFLLFNDRGEPVPWVIRTRMPEGSRMPAIPAVFANVHRDRRLELVVTSCSYSEPPRFGEDRQITGIYVASAATWGLVRPSDIAPYTALVLRSYRFQANHDELLAPDPRHWLNQGNDINPHPPPVQLRAVVPASPDCRGIRIPIVDGHVQREWKDPCSELGRDRIELSNGTVCFGWPTVVIDRRDVREIVADPRRLNLALQSILREHRSVILAGQSEPDRCSPTLLWAPQG